MILQSFRLVQDEQKRAKYCVTALIRTVLRVKIEKGEERFVAIGSRCRGNFTFLFRRLRQRIMHKFVPHMQNDCLSSFNKSNHCFVTLSLWLPWICLNV